MSTQVAIDGPSAAQGSDIASSPLNVVKQAPKVEDAKAKENIASAQSIDLVKKAQEAEKAKEEAAQPTQEELNDAIEVIADFMNLATRNVNFYQDDESEKTVIKVFDAESKELIKQFPSEEVLEIAQKISQLRQDVGIKTGILLDEQV